MNRSEEVLFSSGGRLAASRCLSIVATLLILSTLAWQPTAAQQQSGSSGAQEPATQSPDPSEQPDLIPTAEIASRAELVMSKLREADNLARPVPALEGIADGLPAIAQDIQEAEEVLVQLEATGGALRQIEDARARWQSADRQLSFWSERLTSRTVALSATRQMLISTGQRWELTSTSLDPEEVPPALLARISQVVEEVGLRQQAIQKHLRIVLTLQSEVTTLAAQADGGLEQAERLLKLYRQQVFQADSPPLWKVLGEIGGGAAMSEQIRTALRHDREALGSFFGDSGLRPMFQLLFFCLCLAVLLTIRHQSSQWELPATDEQAAAHILRRPVSTSLILTLMTTAIFYPNAPSIVFEVNRILFLFPVLRLVPGLLGRTSHRPLMMLAALYLADNLVDLALERTFLQRALLMVSTLASMGAGLWIVRRYLDTDLSRPATLLQNRLSHLAILILAGSAIANVLGHVALAGLLTNATLTSAYGVFILFAASQVLGVLISVLLHSRLARQVHSLSRDTELVRLKVGSLLRFLAVSTWIVGTLYFFGLLGIVWAGLNHVLVRQWALGSLTISLGNILAFFLTLWASVLISRFIRFVLMEDVMPRMNLARGMPSSVAQLVHYAVVSLGFLAALGAAGIELSRFAIMAGALGVGIGFGLQSVVNNFVSGLILIFERPMQIGDKIEVGKHRGEVRRIGFRASTIRTFSGAEIIVPNGDLVSKELTNWTLSDHKRRVDVPVGVAYGSDPQLVLRILLEAADREPDALKRPEPKAHFMEFGDSSLNFILRFWTPKFDEWWGVYSKINLAIHEGLREAGVTIPFPQRDLHLRTVDGQAADQLARKTLDGTVD